VELYLHSPSSLHGMALNKYQGLLYLIIITVRMFIRLFKDAFPTVAGNKTGRLIIVIDE
jgi:hypothetical protein